MGTLTKARCRLKELPNSFFVTIMCCYDQVVKYFSFLLNWSLKVTAELVQHTFTSVRHTAIEVASHSVTASHVSYCISPILCQSDTQLLRQAVSHYKSCKLLCQSNIMSVWYTATEAVCQSMHVSYWIIPALSVRHTATKLVSWSLHVSYWFSTTLLARQSDTQLWRQSVSQFM